MPSDATFGSLSRTDRNMSRLAHSQHITGTTWARAANEGSTRILDGMDTVMIHGWLWEKDLLRITSTIVWWDLYRTGPTTGFVAEYTKEFGWKEYAKLMQRICKMYNVTKAQSHTSFIDENHMSNKVAVERVRPLQESPEKGERGTNR